MRRAARFAPLASLLLLFTASVVSAADSGPGASPCTPRT